MPGLTLSEDSKIAIGQNSLPYRMLVSWDQGYSDVYLVNLADGSRKKVLEKFPERRRDLARAVNTCSTMTRPAGTGSPTGSSTARRST